MTDEHTNPTDDMTEISSDEATEREQRGDYRHRTASPNGWNLYPCPRCDTEVHTTWTECPDCGALLPDATVQLAEAETETETETKATGATEDEDEDEDDDTDEDTTSGKPVPDTSPRYDPDDSDDTDTETDQDPDTDPELRLRTDEAHDAFEGGVTQWTGYNPSTDETVPETGGDTGGDPGGTFAIDSEETRGTALSNYPRPGHTLSYSLTVPAWGDDSPPTREAGLFPNWSDGCPHCEYSPIKISMNLTDTDVDQTPSTATALCPECRAFRTLSAPDLLKNKDITVLRESNGETTTEHDAPDLSEMLSRARKERLSAWLIRHHYDRLIAKSDNTHMHRYAYRSGDDTDTDPGTGETEDDR